MKNPARFLCAAAVLVVVWADGSLECDTAKQTAHPSGEKSSSDHPNSIARAADPARALAQAFTLEIGSERESRIRDLLSAWAARRGTRRLRGDLMPQGESLASAAVRGD